MLNFLAENAGEVVSHEDLLKRFWQGSYPSDHAVHKAIAELRSALGDSAHRPSYIRTIPKRGYSLIADVTRTPAQAPETAPADYAEPVSSIELPRSAFLDKRLLAGAVLLIFLSVLLWPSRDVVSEKDETVRLAVLPFANHALDSSNQFLTDGLREALVNGLSKLSHMEVLSPARSFDEYEMAARSNRIADRARALRVDHALHGSIQSAEGRLRVTVQLTRASDGVHQYSEQFDLPLDDLFGLQDQIVSNVVSALSVHLDESERSQMLDWGTTNAIAYERFLRGNFYYNQFNADDFKRAIDYHMSALELDPDFLNAYHGVATAANNLAVYSNSANIQEMSALINNTHREVARLAPDSPVLRSINEIRLRISGVNQVQQEAQLRAQILSGNPPKYAIAHYALLLMSARLYDEAIQLLDKADEVGPFEISPDEEWSYKTNVESPYASILSAKGQLQERPYHVAFLGTVATNLALTGDFRQAEMYLQRQRDVDTDGLLAHYSETIIGFLKGEITLGNDYYKQLMDKGNDFNFNKGALSFMLGDLQKGIELWRNIPPLQRRRLFNVAHSVERYFPVAILEDPRYQAVLEELNAGKSWQRQLMEGVLAMQDTLDVHLNAQSQVAYESGTFMSRNNLWTHAEWAELEARKLTGMQTPHISD